jgi:6-pyruvoyltetrahydropterin/6-carboxytetrahydropterin synthase
MVYVTRRERFSAAHRLWNPNLSSEENLDLFDKCANHNYHGHNYKLFVTAKGQINPKTGYVIDAKVLKHIILKEIIHKVDHKNLSMDVDFLRGINPTTENLLVVFWDILAPKIAAEGAQLHALKLIETENNFAEYYGPSH